MYLSYHKEYYSRLLAYASKQSYRINYLRAACHLFDKSTKLNQRFDNYWCRVINYAIDMCMLSLDYAHSLHKVISFCSQLMSLFQFY